MFGDFGNSGSDGGVGDIDYGDDMEVAVSDVAGDGEDEFWVFFEDVGNLGDDFGHFVGVDDEVVDEGGGVFVADFVA